MAAKKSKAKAAPHKPEQRDLLTTIIEKSKPEAKPQRPEKMALITSIIERGNGNRLMKFYSEHQVFTHIRCEGTGTATSEILDILGLGSSEKDIIFSPLCPWPGSCWTGWTMSCGAGFRAGESPIPCR